MYNFKGIQWKNADFLISLSFVCWNCGNQVASNKGYKTQQETLRKRIYLCPHCDTPNIFDTNGREVLSSLPGGEINKLPENIDLIYSEIRKCMQSKCYNGSIMLMRKLIMHIAVEEEAEEGKNFVEYIDYLCRNGFVPKKSANKANSVRILGNSTNHEIENRTEIEAKNCFEFIELLLKVNYEFADEDDE